MSLGAHRNLPPTVAKEVAGTKRPDGNISVEMPIASVDARSWVHLP